MKYVETLCFMVGGYLLGNYLVTATRFLWSNVDRKNWFKEHFWKLSETVLLACFFLGSGLQTIFNWWL